MFYLKKFEKYSKWVLVELLVHNLQSTNAQKTPKNVEEELLLINNKEGGKDHLIVAKLSNCHFDIIAACLLLCGQIDSRLSVKFVTLLMQISILM